MPLMRGRLAPNRFALLAYRRISEQRVAITEEMLSRVMCRCLKKECRHEALVSSSHDAGCRGNRSGCDCNPCRFCRYGIDAAQGCLWVSGEYGDRNRCFGGYGCCDRVAWRCCGRTVDYLCYR